MIVDTGATSLTKVAAYDPDIVVCDQYAFSCTFSFLNTLYDAGYSIASLGNDTLFGILPIVSSGGPFAATTGVIKPDDTSHFIAR